MHRSAPPLMALRMCSMLADTTRHKTQQSGVCTHAPHAHLLNGLARPMLVLWVHFHIDAVILRLQLLDRQRVHHPHDVVGRVDVPSQHANHFMRAQVRVEVHHHFGCRRHLQRKLLCGPRAAAHRAPVLLQLHHLVVIAKGRGGSSATPQ